MTTILDAVYIDMKGSKSIVSLKAKPAFQAVLEVTDREPASSTGSVRTQCPGQNSIIPHFLRRSVHVLSALPFRVNF